MAKYTITHTCGHEHAYQLCGPEKERKRKLDWMAEQECPRCRRKAEGVLLTVRPLAADQVELMLSGDTYPRRDEIKALGGWRFDHYGYVPAHDILGAKARPAWMRELPKSEAANVIASLLRNKIADQVEVRSYAQGIFSAITEGRPELAGLQLQDDGTYQVAPSPTPKPD
jgi:hypothetical protein